VKLPAWKRKELPSVHDNLEAKQIVIAGAAPETALHGAERVNNRSSVGLIPRAASLER